MLRGWSNATLANGGVLPSQQSGTDGALEVTVLHDGWDADTHNIGGQSETGGRFADHPQ